MEQNEQRFEAYFKGQLSYDEVQKFNNELASNEDFNLAYQFFISVKQATSSKHRDNIRSQLDGIDVNKISDKESSENPDISKKQKSSFKDKFSRWVLVLLGIFVITYFSYKYFISSSPDAIYASNFELYEAQNVRGDAIDELKSLYQQKQYEIFINEAKKIETSPEILMMLANAHMQLQDYDAAHSVLLDVPEESSFRDLKYWNLGLVSLKLNNIPQAKNHFNYLQSISNYKKSKTKKILSKLSK